MRVIRINPRGYCYGVVDAIQLARRVARDPDAPKPIYVLGQIVHNRHAVEGLAQFGIINLDGSERTALLEQVTSGTVIFTAHGVSPVVKERARQRGLHCVDATCPDVTRTHELVKTLVSQGFQIVYIGKKGHPEPEGVVGEAPGNVHLVTDERDVAGLQLSGARVAVTTQTTLSKWDTDELIGRILQRYPEATVYNEICMATQQRQEAAVQQSAQADVVIVVGDARSNNSNRLVQVVHELGGKPAHLVDSVDDIQPRWLEGKTTVAVTAGSSTPSEITRAVIQYLERL